MDLHGKQRRQVRRRNFVAKELNSKRFRQQVVGDKRRFLIDKLNEDEAEEELKDFDG